MTGKVIIYQGSLGEMGARVWKHHVESLKELLGEDMLLFKNFPEVEACLQAMRPTKREKVAAIVIIGGAVELTNERYLHIDGVPYSETYAGTLEGFLKLNELQGLSAGFHHLSSLSKGEVSRLHKAVGIEGKISHTDGWDTRPSIYAEQIKQAASASVKKGV